MQIHQLMDACFFAASFWLAYQFRASQNVIDFFRLEPVASFDTFVWTYLVLIPAAPLVLESQGFYNRSMLCPWRSMVWSLLKSCVIITLGLVMLLVFVRLYLPRTVIICFGFVAFVLIYVKQQLLRVFFRSDLARAQYVRRFILVGTGDEIQNMRQELKSRPEEEIAVVAELELDKTPVQKLAGLLHEHSINGVILSAKHAYFEQIETAVRTCEIEGVEAWLVADFFKTQISRTSLDDFHGRPVVVFSATPEASWQSVLKFLLD
ncbi:MAG TPA: sugar transferase, partial [Verrucomicrobiae bacterium]|nr:sugar transferase [Verrucomicrobiae bacterium]